MEIDAPKPSQIPQLRQLWKEAFGDTDAYLDLFFGSAFSSERCRCVTAEGQTASALYWFDCRYQGRPVAYLYAVATAPSHRRKGFAAALLGDTHRHLKALGYAGAILVPATAELFGLYARFGYQPCCQIAEFDARAGSPPAALQHISWQEYAALRPAFLPPDSVLQDGTTMAFLSAQADFYKAPDLLLCTVKEGDTLFVKEYLGDPALASGVVAALCGQEGHFRTPGCGRPFAMYLPLSDAAVPPPCYFGFALD